MIQQKSIGSIAESLNELNKTNSREEQKTYGLVGKMKHLFSKIKRRLIR